MKNLTKKRKVNPFELHINHPKHTILGQKSKDDHGLPGISRAKALKKREKTLLREYQNRYKGRDFKDKRIGEYSKSLNPEKKIIMRLAAEKKKEFSNRNIFSLHEEVLTHGGQELTDETMKKAENFSDDEDADELLDAEFVKQRHFGGGLFVKANEENKIKSRKEWIEDIIVESKKKKFESKQEKEVQNEAVTKLNEQFHTFLSLMKGKRINDEDKDKSKKTCDFSDYDRIVQEAQKTFDKAKPTDRTKTFEEIAKEDEDKLRRLEEERLKRMRGEESVVCDMKSADSLDDGFSYISKSEDTKDQSIDVKQNIDNMPFTFEVPSYDDFWKLLKDWNPSDVSTLIERMIKCNHPSLGSQNRTKCNQIFKCILQTLYVITSQEPAKIKDEVDPLEYIDPLVPHAFELAQLIPEDTAWAINEVINEKYDDYNKSGKKYPYADTFIFLKLAGLLFPASDYNHDVMTRVITFLTQLLGEAKVSNGREVVAVLFTASMLIEYLKRSGRFVGELINALCGLLTLSLPLNKKSSLPLFPPFKRYGNSSNILILDNPVKSFKYPKFSFSLLNQDNISICDNLKVRIIINTLKLLISLSEMWKVLPSSYAIYDPVRKILKSILSKMYPKEVNDLIKELKKKIDLLPKTQHKLKKIRVQVKTLKMFEPQVDDKFEGFKKRAGSKGYQESQKLLHKVKRERKGAKRELKRDAQCIARQQLKEVLHSDAERKRKVNIIMQGLATQEHECKKFKKL